MRQAGFAASQVGGTEERPTKGGKKIGKVSKAGKSKPVKANKANKVAKTKPAKAAAKKMTPNTDEPEEKPIEADLKLVKNSLLKDVLESGEYNANGLNKMLLIRALQNHAYEVEWELLGFHALLGLCEDLGQDIHGWTEDDLEHLVAMIFREEE